MSFSQQQLDDLLEDLIALTNIPDSEEQVRRLAQLCLLLIEQIDDPEKVRAALTQVSGSCDPPPARPIP